MAVAVSRHACAAPSLRVSLEACVRASPANLTCDQLAACPSLVIQFWELARRLWASPPGVTAGPCLPSGTPSPVPAGAGMDGPCSFSTVCHSGPEHSVVTCSLREGVAASALGLLGSRHSTGTSPGLRLGWAEPYRQLSRDQLDTREAGAGAPPLGPLPVALPSAGSALARALPPLGAKS